jgi:hypothetical protein
MVFGWGEQQEHAFTKGSYDESVILGKADANGISFRAHYDVDCGA